MTEIKNFQIFLIPTIGEGININISQTSIENVPFFMIHNMKNYVSQSIETHGD